MNNKGLSSHTSGTESAVSYLLKDADVWSSEADFMFGLAT